MINEKWMVNGEWSAFDENLALTSILSLRERRMQSALQKVKGDRWLVVRAALALWQL